MFSVTFKIVPFGSDDYQAAFTLKEQILRLIPQGCGFLPSEIEAEKYYTHIAGFLESQVCAAASLEVRDDHALMRRVAIQMNLQRQGIGTELLHFCEAYAKELGLTHMLCKATLSAIPFYLKRGYQPEGEIEGAFPYQVMRKALA